MFALIHKNLYREKIATFVSKTTFHRWLNGGSPHLAHLSACDEILNTDSTVAYVRKFTGVAKQLSETNELQKVNEILKISGLEKDDITLLENHHKNRIWRKNTEILTAREESHEC
ncbi:MAG: hypothetical protein AB7D34_01310 [Sulfurimonas sp.]